MSTHSQVSRRDSLRVGAAVVVGAMAAACASAPPAQPEGPVANGEEALQRLIDGNKCCVADKSIDLNQSESRRVKVAGGQKPFATIA